MRAPQPVRFSTISHGNSGWRSGPTTSVWRCNAIAVPGDSTTVISAGTYHVRHRNRAVAIHPQREDASDRRMPVRRVKERRRRKLTAVSRSERGGSKLLPSTGLRVRTRSERRFGLISARLHRVGSHYRAATFQGLPSRTYLRYGSRPRPRRYQPHHVGIASSMR
jgi:hypothetical protein